jgi:hypothetical protein
LLCLMVCHILHVLPYHLLLFRGLCLHALMTRHIAIHSCPKCSLPASSTLVAEVSFGVLCTRMHGAFLLVDLLLLVLMRERGRVLA